MDGWMDVTGPTLLQKPLSLVLSRVTFEGGMKSLSWQDRSDFHYFEMVIAFILLLSVPHVAKTLKSFESEP